MITQSEIHIRALEIANRYKRAEADLIDILQKVDTFKVYYQHHCKSLFEYTVKILGLSESVAFNFITVARKAKEIPELKSVIQSGALSVSKARKITSVLTKENQIGWLKMAVELPQRKLEQEVAKFAPKELTPEKLKFVSEDRLSLQIGISEALEKKLKRVQDLESQKLRKPITLENTLEALVENYLRLQDPIQKAEYLKNRKNLAVARQVVLRDRGQCTFTDPRGIRCAERRWLDVHHVFPKKLGGDNSLENLATMCSGHHRMVHSH